MPITQLESIVMLAFLGSSDDPSRLLHRSPIRNRFKIISQPMVRSFPVMHSLLRQSAKPLHHTAVPSSIGSMLLRRSIPAVISPLCFGYVSLTAVWAPLTVEQSTLPTLYVSILLLCVIMYDD